MNALKIKTYLDRSAKPSPGLRFEKPSLTVESVAKNCDINNILARYRATGVMPHLAVIPPTFVDAVGLAERSADAFAFVEQTKAFFDALPSELRAEVGTAENLAKLIDENPELSKKVFGEAFVKAEKLPVESTISVEEKGVAAGGGNTEV